MTPITTRDLCEFGGGRHLSGPHQPLGGLSIDTRTFRPDDGTFVCLRGERFDGHGFIDAAIQAGAKVLVVDRAGAHRVTPAVRERPGFTVIEVDDGTVALGALAAWHRTRFAGLVVAVTGSSGKTTTKELIAAALSPLGPIHRTTGNWNNHLGVPLTLLGLTSAHRAAVVEMGMSAPGEIAYLAELTAPHFGVITTVGAAHLAGVGTLEDVARAKGELFDALTQDGLAFLPSEVALPWILTRHLKARLVLVGPRRGDDVQLGGAKEGPRGAKGWLKVDGARHTLSLKLAGRHNLTNAGLALAVAAAAGVSHSQALRSIAAVSPPPMRGELRQLKDGARLILDCYNANPQSMEVAVRTFAERGPSGVLVLGDMLELGEVSESAHAGIGQVVASLAGEFTLVAVGRYGRTMVDAARAAGLPVSRSIAVVDADDAGAWLARFRKSGADILLKASRGVRLERVLNSIHMSGEAAKWSSG